MKSEFIAVRLQPELKTELADMAVRNGFRTISRLVRAVLSQAVAGGTIKLEDDIPAEN